jgi:hypothetical protein
MRTLSNCCLKTGLGEKGDHKNLTNLFTDEKIQF